MELDKKTLDQLIRDVKHTAEHLSHISDILYRHLEEDGQYTRFLGSVWRAIYQVQQTVAVKYIEQEEHILNEHGVYVEMRTVEGEDILRAMYTKIHGTPPNDTAVIEMQYGIKERCHKLHLRIS